MKLKSLRELGAALPCPASVEASALVRDADELLAQLDALASTAREARTRAAGAADTISTLEARAQAIEDQLAQVQGLAAFMGDETRLVQDLAAQAAEMRQMAQALRDDPAVRAYSELQAAEEAAREKAAAEVRARLHAMLRQASEVLAQGNTEKASALIEEIRAKASAGSLAAEFGGPTAELESIVAQARAEVKARQAAKQERETRRAFGTWLRETVLSGADFGRGDVVVTLGLGQGLHLRPRRTRRGNVVWDPVSAFGVEAKGTISTMPRRAKVWDWRRQAPQAACTLEEAIDRVPQREPARPALRLVAEPPVEYQAAQQDGDEPVSDPTSAQQDAAPVVGEEPAPAVGEVPVPVAEAPAAESQQDGDLDRAIVAALQEAAQAAPPIIGSPVAEASAGETADAPAAEPEGPHLVVFEAEDAMLAQYWASIVAEILTELGHEAIGATVTPATPHVAAHGLVIDAAAALEVEVTVNGRILATPRHFASRSGVKTPARRERNVAASLRRQLARACAS